jgi:OmpA-OmpF porin, OOP family
VNGSSVASPARRPRSLLLAALSALLLLVAVPREAQAQSLGNNTFGLQLFRPAVDSKGYITVNASQVLGHLDWSLGLVGSYARNVFQMSGNGSHFGVTDYVTPQLQAALGLFKWFEIGVSLPLNIEAGHRTPGYKSPFENNNTDLTFSGQFIGDIGIHLKARALNTSRYPVGLGFLFSIYAPSGKGKSLTGESQVTLRPEIIVDREWGRSRRWKTALNVGALIRPSVHNVTDNGQTLQFGSPTEENNDMPFCAPAPVGVSYPTTGCGTQQTRKLGTQLTYSIAAAYALVNHKLDLIGEVYGYGDLTGNKYGFPLEALLAMKVYMARNSYFQFGGGAGVLQGKLTPSSIQGTGNMIGSPQWRVFLGFIFEPSIGDRDGDGIKDDVDKCPDDPEDFDDFEDEDGCPDPDNDRDGILDRDDKCPNEPETKNGFEDADGCPDTLDLDRDGDGIPDRLDKCPDDPEDKDGFEDKDGCPDLDNDKDHILDAVDMCPNQPETYNGYQDQDGCPDRQFGTKYVICPDVIMDRIYFAEQSATIKPASKPILDQLAKTLKANPSVVSVTCVGQASSEERYPPSLSLARAKAVMTYLVRGGIAAKRLHAVGKGIEPDAGVPLGQTGPDVHRVVHFDMVRAEVSNK